jgi:exodeoxyribonuclease V beta subunit
VLARPDGERLLTDLRHVGQVLHAAALRESLGPTALAEWLRSRIAQAPVEGADERSRRLETDAAAVQVMTVPVSKGLEFPVVYVPFAWDRWVPDTLEVLRLHDDAGNRGARGRRLQRAWLRRGPRPAQRGGGGRGSEAALRRPHPGAEPGRRPLGAQRQHRGCAATPAALRRHRARGLTAGQRSADVSRFTRNLDEEWRRTSYSALTRAAHDAHLASEPDEPGTDDEREAATAVPEPAPADGGLASPMSDLPGEAIFGTLVHAVLPPRLRGSPARGSRCPAVPDTASR